MRKFTCRVYLLLIPPFYVILLYFLIYFYIQEAHLHVYFWTMDVLFPFYCCTCKKSRREIETLKKEKESDRIELEKRLEDAAKMLTTVLKPTAVKKEAASSAGKGFGNKRKSP